MRVLLPPSPSIYAWLTIATCGLVVGCAAGQTIRQDAPAENLPYVTWEISAGSGEGDTSVVCSSRQTARTCLLTASTTKMQQAASVTLELHAAAQPVSYTGTITPGFLASQHPQKVTHTLEPANKVSVFTVLDAITSKPGSYTIDIELSAVMGGTSHPIRVSVPVTVQ